MIDWGYVPISNNHPTLIYNSIKGVSHCSLAIYILKKYVKAKERIMKTQIFHHAKMYLIFKKSL